MDQNPYSRASQAITANSKALKITSLFMTITELPTSTDFPYFIRKSRIRKYEFAFQNTDLEKADHTFNFTQNLGLQYSSVHILYTACILMLQDRNTIHSIHHHCVRRFCTGPRKTGRSMILACLIICGLPCALTWPHSLHLHIRLGDIQTHIGSKKHKSAVESSKSTARGSGNIANFFQPKAFSVIGAETLMTQVLCVCQYWNFWHKFLLRLTSSG